MSKSGRAVIAIVVAGAVTSLAAWVDGSVMQYIGDLSSRGFHPTGNLLRLAISLGSLAVAGSVLLLGVLAWRSHSALVGASYTLVGAFFAFLPVILYQFVAHSDVNLPVLPQPIADAVREIYLWSNGPLNADGMIGAGMLVVGILVLGRSLRGRSVGQGAESLTGANELPAQP